MRYAWRRDTNDAGLKELAEALGWWLIQTNEPSDYLGGYRGVWHVVEIKDPKKQGHKHEFTTKQKEFHVEAYRRGMQILIWRTPEDVQISSKARATA